MDFISELNSIQNNPMLTPQNIIDDAEKDLDSRIANSIQGALENLKTACESSKGVSLKDVSVKLHELGRAYSYNDQAQKAERCYLTYLKLQLVDSKNAPTKSVGEALYELAYLNDHYLQKSKKAEEFYTLYLDTMRKACKEDDEDLLYAIRRVAYFYDGENEPLKALNLINELLAKREKIWPGDHPEVVEALVDSGEFHERLHHWEEARLAYKKAIEMAHGIVQKSSSSNNVHLRSSRAMLMEAYHCLGWLEYSLGEYQAQRKAFADAQPPDVALFSTREDLPYWILVENFKGLGSAFLELGEYESALKAFDACLREYSPEKSPCSRDIFITLYQKAIVYENIEDASNANRFYLKSLKQFESNSMDKISRVHVEALSRYVLFLKAYPSYGSADALIESIKDILSEVQTRYPEEQDNDLALGLMALGVGYWRSHPQEALKYLKASSEMFECLLGERSTTERVMAEAYLALFLAEQQSEEAQQHFQITKKLLDLHKAKTTVLGATLKKLEEQCASALSSVG